MMIWIQCGCVDYYWPILHWPVYCPKLLSAVHVPIVINFQIIKEAIQLKKNISYWSPLDFILENCMTKILTFASSL